MSENGEYKSQFRGVFNEDDTDNWTRDLKRNMGATITDQTLALIQFYSGTPSKPKEEPRDEFSEIPAPPTPPECRIIYEGFMTARVFEKESEYLAWKALPWYKRIFR
jgi:hypothetical protein